MLFSSIYKISNKIKKTALRKYSRQHDLVIHLIVILHSNPHKIGAPVSVLQVRT